MKAFKFEASWCQPCKNMSRVLDGIKEQLTVPVEAIDIDENADMAKQYAIRGVPTMVLVDSDGKEVKRKVGMMREAEILEFFKQG